MVAAVIDTTESEMGEIAKTESREIAAQSGGGDVMSVLQAAIDKGHSVDVVEKLLDMQERILATQARQAYNSAIHAVQTAVTPVRKAGYNEHTRQKYGRLEDMWRELRPLLSEHGLALSFYEQPVEKGPRIFICKVMHAAGESEEYPLSLPVDTSGSKNPIQGIGSTTTYARRYLASMIFGITFENEDDDGIGGQVDAITAEQALDIQAMLDELPTGTRDALLGWLRVKTVDAIPAAKYKTVVANLERKRKGLR